ncbi:MAG: aldose epimerase family protein [Bacteroidales bacterium]|nr:aldose epimerase family protein [Bacteroidales bacterium]
MKLKFFSLMALVAIGGSFYSCQKKAEAPKFNLIPEKAFEATIDGKPVKLYTLQNNTGITMQVTNFGGRVVSLFTPDKNGNYEDIVLGYENLDRYVHNTGERFLGATIGRFGNRIAKGHFELDGQEYNLSAWSNGQCLHGGDKAFDMVVWNVDSVTPNSIYFSYLSPDMEEGFPGNLDVKMVYSLSDDGSFKVEHYATTDKATPVNLTHHSFFNFHGEGKGSINDHIMMINADSIVPVDSDLIPFGKLAAVENTPFDFRKPTEIGLRVDNDDEQLKLGHGYDHCFVINRKADNDLELACSVLEPTSGRYMEVYTTEPGVQFYGGNFFDGSSVGKTNDPLKHRESFALETQHYPDSPNQPEFPTTILQPGEKYSHVCVYKFGVKQ